MGPAQRESLEAEKAAQAQKKDEDKVTHYSYNFKTCINLQIFLNMLLVLNPIFESVSKVK